MIPLSQFSEAAVAANILITTPHELLLYSLLLAAYGCFIGWALTYGHHRKYRLFAERKQQQYEAFVKERQRWK